ncbi:MAG: c-type cytochrome [Actinomycetia bacterium]|nr:c-type cytochrome [Actinomycetes bacterium]
MKSLAIKRRHPAAVLALILVALVATGGLFAITNTMTEAKSAEQSAAQIIEGKRLFLEGCSSCHGINLQGTENGPTLIGVGAAAVDFQVATGRMPLATYSAQAPSKEVIYTEEEIAALAAYVASLSPGPAIPSAADLDFSDADLGEGGELFRANCSQCHQAAGRGGALNDGRYAPDLMPATSQEIYEAMLTGPQNMPVFSDATLSVEDKQGIIAYIDYLKNSEDPGGWALGRFGPVTEGLFLWIGGMLLAVACAIWIGAKVR